MVSIKLWKWGLKSANLWNDTTCCEKLEENLLPQPNFDEFHKSFHNLTQIFPEQCLRKIPSLMTVYDTSTETHMVEITQEENPSIEKLNICTVVAVFAPLRKTLLQFGLNSTLTHFPPFYWCNRVKLFFEIPKKSMQKHICTTIWEIFWRLKVIFQPLFVFTLIWYIKVENGWDLFGSFSHGLEILLI